MNRNQINKTESKPGAIGDHIDIRFVPLPPEKRIAWERSMRLLTEILLEILSEDANGITEECHAVLPPQTITKNLSL